jgi:hypothetical protein
MSSSEEPRPQLSDWQDAEIARYHAVSKLAVAGLLFGLAAFLAVIEPVLYFVPLTGIALSAAALGAIARSEQSLLGRKAALVGLALSLAVAAAAPAHWITYRHLVRREAREFALAWFDLLRGGEPQKAFQLTRHPNSRQPLGEGLWDYYRQNPHVRMELETYVAPPDGRWGNFAPKLVRTLLALGPKAEARYFSTDLQGRIGGIDTVYQVYAVTFGEGPQRKTFFVGLEMKRLGAPSSRHAAWQITRADGGVKPLALGGSPEKVD